MLLLLDELNDFMQKDLLSSEITFLSGVGPQRAAILNKELSIFTFEDLLYYFPYKYEDRTKFYALKEISAELPYIQAKGKITYFEIVGEAHNERLTANFTDGTDNVELVWFKGVKWVQKNIKKGVEYIIYGKPTEFKGRINISHPEIEEAAKQETKINAALQAAYNTSEKMKRSYLNSKSVARFMQTLFQNLKQQIPENLPEYVVNQLNMISLHEALLNIHFPKNAEMLLKAQYRLKFSELFYIQLKMLSQKKLRQQKCRGFVFTKVGNHFNNFFKNNLPFELTEAQKRVVREIRKDTVTGKQMNRLLQGDVGSGKTLVALMCMLLAIDNGFQTSLMAPTEILANQHFKTITKFLCGIPVEIRLLTGSTKTKERKEIFEKLQRGEIHILVGTHALLEDTVQFQNLGFVVVDEQHKFGVAQRAKMWQKNTTAPHMLVMTATPIPRTLAMTLYGDLDVSVIDELPPGRQPIKTYHYFDSQRLKVFDFMRKKIAEGRQIYIVYPLINESETMTYKDLTDGYESISRAFPPPQYAVSVVHGKMTSEEKEKSMQYFVKGITHIMVATTVIEVGVDVPNASVMIIESAERFGLSQLHQLRGRVGRGGEQSYCILMTSPKLSVEGKNRIQTMVHSNDGFEIAEVDLRLRGPGELDGTQQSGLPINLKISNLAKDGQIVQLARNVVIDILDHDENLELTENQILKQNLLKQESSKTNWTVIS